MDEPDVDPWRAPLTTKAPYLPVDTPPARLPDGFAPAGVELVCRHGSRAIAKLRTAYRADALLTRARETGALTAAGHHVASALRDYLAVAEAAGEGELTERGRDELRGLAVRMAGRLPSLLASRSAPDVEVLSAPKRRARDSADAFLTALGAGSGRPPPEVRVDEQLLYFHKSDPRYRHYLDHDARLATTLAAARSRPETLDAARSLLTVLVATPFVDEIATGLHQDLVGDVTAAASCIYAVWQATAGSLLAGAVDGSDHRLLLPPLQWFGYLDDLETFFEKGPGFAGDDITYGMARGLLTDMIESATARLHDGDAPVARLRFTHAEEILPLATLLGLPGADRPVADSETYTYAGNPFRGAELAPMAANIQWEIYANGTTALIRMLVNERPTRFAPDLRPVDGFGELYRLSDVTERYRTLP